MWLVGTFCKISVPCYKNSSRLCHMNLGIKGQQDGVTDPSPGKSCHPPLLAPGFLLPSSLSFCFSFLGVDLEHGAVILQNVPQLENGSLSIHLLSSMAQGWGKGPQEGMFQRPKLHRGRSSSACASTQHKVSRPSPPWGTRAGVTGTLWTWARTRSSSSSSSRRD